MTRAENRLILSYAEKRSARGWPKLVAAAIAPTIVSMRLADRVIQPVGVPAGSAIAGVADQLVDRPPVVSRRDGAAAVTSVARFHACPRKFLLSTISEARSPMTDGIDGDDGGGMAFGEAVHRILAGEILDSSDATELASRFRVSELGRRSERADRIEREFDFLFYFEDVVLRGQIDLWFEESGELIVVDYKTDRDESPEAYALQLQFYALALERYAGRIADRAMLYYLRPDRAIDVPIDADAARSAVRAFLKAQDSLEYPRVDIQ